MTATPIPLSPLSILPTWIEGAGLLIGLGLLGGLWVALGRLRDLRGDLQRLERLESIEASLSRLAAERGDLDLRRLEHVLLEVREALRRMGDAWLASSQTARRPEAPERVPDAPAGLGERVVNRLLALGYERVRLITPPEELAALAAEARGGNGEITVEARRDGALCKGRVLLRSGALTEVEIRPSYSVFP
jgi:hypothetical protein